MTDATDVLLAEREKTHGDFVVHARVTQSLKRVVEYEQNWGRLSPPQREAIHMIFHKVGRIVAGDPNVADHWDDITGYARLVSRRCPPSL